MNQSSIFALSVFSVLVAAMAGRAGAATLAGQWTFEAGSLADSTGNFSNLTLHGNASVIAGALDVNGSGASPTGWASATMAPGKGVPLSSKTLVSWITLDSLGASSGSAITLDSSSVDKFDGIVFGERSANRWMNGSNAYSRSGATTNFTGLNAVTASTGVLMQLAVTYEVSGASVLITGYRDGTLMGSYTSGNAASWTAAEQEIIFGVRHTIGTAQGALDARIHEARLYDGG
jgi:hypothetical protein